MKKLYIMNETVSSKGNGIGTYIRELITCLSGLDIQITILAFNSTRDFFSIEEEDNVTYFYFPGIPCSFQENWKLYNIFYRLYIPDSPDNIFLINYSPCSLLMKAVKVSHPLSKQIYVIHDMGWTIHLFGDFDAYTRILKKQNRKNADETYIHLWELYHEEKTMCELADKIVCLSEDADRLLALHYRIESSKLCLIPHGISHREPVWQVKKRRSCRQKMFLGEDEKIILYVGRMVDTKGIFVLIEAFKDVLKSYPKCRLVIAGAVNKSDYVFKSCLSVISKVIFTGLLLQDELEKWYQIADIGVIPSYTEQCGYVGIEMMAHGLPVVASDGFGVRCMFRDGINAKVASIGNRRLQGLYRMHLTESLLHLLHSRAECMALSRRSRKIFLSNYSIEVIRKKYQQLFDCG